jgi:Family of unknown function (DUF5715)
MRLVVKVRGKPLPFDSLRSLRSMPVVIAAAVWLLCDVTAHAETAREALDRMMVELQADNLNTSAVIREAYRDYVDLLRLNTSADIEDALASGGLAPLPPNPLRYNLVPRMEGPNPIGQMDLENQQRYLAARPAALGCLIVVASRVHSGPLEITSLVRDNEYQEVLRETNANAITTIPMHTLGLAFDIAVINTPLRTVYETRDVLRRMQDEGALLFIGERQQLVFHVVPHPSRLGDFMRVYAKAFGAPSAARAAEVVAPSSPSIVPMPAIFEAPRVRTEIVSAIVGDAAGETIEIPVAIGTSGADSDDADLRAKAGRLSANVILGGFTLTGLLMTMWQSRRRT